MKKITDGDNRKMVFTIGVACAIFIVMVVYLVIMKVNPAKNPLDKDILATSNYGNITASDIKNYLKDLEVFFKRPFEFDKLSKEETQIIIREIVSGRALAKKAKDENITSDKVYTERLGIISNNLMREIFLDKLIAKNVTDAAIMDKYDEMVKFLADKMEYKVRHIVVKTEDEIKKVVYELRTNTFEKLAEKYSIDASKENGGDLGYVVEGQVVKEFGDVIKSQPLNRMTKPFSTVYGWHVAIKEDERKAVVPSFEESRDSIKASLTAEFIKKYSQDNLRESNIQFK
jgi:parvulin-like peptidyl-prolyl isomerase